MANAKVTLNGVTLIDLTSDTVTASDILQGKVAHGSDGSIITGIYVPATASLTTGSANPSESSQHITPPSGYDGFEYFDVGAIPSKYKDITGADAVASQVLSGKKFVNSTGLVTGTMTDRGAVNKVLTTARDEDVYTVPSGYHNGSGVVRIYPEIKSGIIPTKSQQNIYPSTGSVLSLVTISAIPSAYQDVTGVTATASEVLASKVFVDSSGTEITGTMTNWNGLSTTLDATTGKQSMTIPSGYHNGLGVVNIVLEEKTATPSESAQVIQPTNGKVLSKVSIGAVSSNYIGSNIAQRSATDLSASGSVISVPSGYYAATASKAIPAGSATTPAKTISVTPSISVNTAGAISVSVAGSSSVTPTVSAGYVSSGTAGTVSVSGSSLYQLSTQAAATITPTESEQTAVTSGKYTTGVVKVGAISSTYVGSGIAQRSALDLTASGSVVSVPSGYYASATSKAVSAGSASTPAKTINVTPSVSLNSATGVITVMAAGSSSITPTVGAGYVSTGVAGTVSVSGSNTYSLTSKPAQTYMPGTADLTIAAGQYLTGAQTIAGDTNLVASNIVENVTIFGVTGSLALPSVSGEILILTGSVDGTVLSL